MNIRMKFTLAALVAALLPLGGYFAISYAESERQVQSQVAASFEEGTAIGTQRLDDWYFTNQSAVKTMARTPKLMTADPALAKIELINAVKPYPWVRAAFVTDPKGAQTMRSDAEKPVEVGDRPYYKQAKDKGFGRQLIVSRVTNKPSLIMATPLDANTGGEGGVAAFAIDLDPISKAVVGTSAMGEQSKAAAGLVSTGERRFIATDDGKLLAHSVAAQGAAKAGELPDITKHPLWAAKPAPGQMALVRYADADGVAWVGAIKQSKLGWYMAVELPEAEVNAPLKSMRTRAGLAIGAAALFAALVAFLAGGLLARPIRTLTEVTENIAAGKFDDAGLASIKSKDEIGDLAQSIKRLSSSVKIAMDSLARKK